MHRSDCSKKDLVSRPLVGKDSWAQGALKPASSVYVSRPTFQGLASWHTLRSRAPRQPLGRTTLVDATREASIYMLSMRSQFPQILANVVGRPHGRLLQLLCCSTAPTVRPGDGSRLDYIS